MDHAPLTLLCSVESAKQVIELLKPWVEKEEIGIFSNYNLPDQIIFGRKITAFHYLLYTVKNRRRPILRL